MHAFWTEKTQSNLKTMSQNQDEASGCHFKSFMRQRTLDWYPDIYHRTYFIPPVYMNRTHHQPEQLAEHDVFITLPPDVRTTGNTSTILQESSVRDDCSQRLAFECLQNVCDKEVMFVISQLRFGDYLNEPSYTAAASVFPRPCDLTPVQKHRGDFDVLVIHRRYGFLVGEIKATGDRLVSYSQEEQDQRVKEKVERSVRQLKKAEEVLQHLLSDLDAKPAIRKTLMMPNLSSKQLCRVLAYNQDLKQDLCQCLDVSNDCDPIPLCLTSDTVSSPDQWWNQWVANGYPDTVMTDAVYLDLVSRFAGPATTVAVHCAITPRLAHTQRCDLRTFGEGIQETACRFAPVQIVLHPRQVDILSRQEPLVFLTGPPGTGKSLVLLLKALDWLQQGHRVQVVSVWKAGRAVSYLLVQQLRQMAGADSERLIRHQTFDLSDGSEAVSCAVDSLMEQVRETGQLFLVMDEALQADLNNRELFTSLCLQLYRQVPDLHLWSASMHHAQHLPLLIEYRLTQPLRSPPVVTRMVQQSYRIRTERSVCNYTDIGSPLPSDGPPHKVVRHAGQRHSADVTASDCEQCGRELADQFRELNIGGAGRGGKSPEPLRYRDVFILTSHGDLHDMEKDSLDNVMRPTSGLLRGLREAGVPFTVLNSGDASALEDVATMAGPDQAVVADRHDVSGLERKVVVVVQRLKESWTWDQHNDMLYSMSRCTAQLIWVRPPLDVENVPDV